jgi:unsaturated rhamnogalacturonyl hydrolase
MGGDSQETILPRIQAPQFARRDFSIVDFVGVADADCTVALAKAVAACHAAGGGRVVVPAGLWLTGAVHLQSNVNLHLAEGATLRFNPEPAQYLPVVLTRFEGIARATRRRGRNFRRGPPRCRRRCVIRSIIGRTWS